MGKERREKIRESKGKDRDDRGSVTVISDDDKEKKNDKSKDRSRDRKRNRSRERGRDRSRERDQDKTKEKWDGDRERKRKRSRDREGRRDEKDGSSELKRRGSRKHHQKSGRSSSVSDEESAQVKKKSKGVDDESPSGESGDVAKGSGDISLSVEETNKLRASLGLKPLQVDQQESSENSVTKEVHAPPSNIGNLQAAEKLREKMETIREKRKQHKKLSAVKKLGEPDEDESVVAWVQRSKLIQEEKEKAGRRAQLLTEMDEEFGVGELVQGTLEHQKPQTYTAEDLKGLTVEHKTEGFVTGKELVLTLKDAGVLEDAEDVLINVNLIEAENAAHNIELKKKKTVYDPYENMDVEESVPKPVLKKYDEEIEGLKKPTFELGDFGSVDTSKQREADIVKQKLQSQAVTLQQRPVQIASEYFTKDEIVQFRKPKRKKKVRRLKADDLLGLSAEKDEFESQCSELCFFKGLVSVDEDVEPLIGSALQRTQRLLKEGKTKTYGAAKVAQMIQSDVGKTSSDALEAAIVLDKTAEFCRQLGDKDEPLTVNESEADAVGVESQEGDIQEILGGWTEVEMNAPRDFQHKEEELYQEAEPVVSSGLSAALEMAGRKGFIDTSKHRKDSSSVVHVYSDIQRDRDYERQKERERERDLSHSRSVSFPEKKSYNPHVSIEYVDDKGRELTPKEAFRYMSHKFHGRGSGKKKTEKRMKKLQEEHFMNKASSVDTPLNTLAMLKSKQQKSQTPYILISGGSQSMLAPDLEKK